MAVCSIYGQTVELRMEALGRGPQARSTTSVRIPKHCCGFYAALDLHRTIVPQLWGVETGRTKLLGGIKAYGRPDDPYYDSISFTLLRPAPWGPYPSRILYLPSTNEYGLIVRDPRSPSNRRAHGCKRCRKIFRTLSQDIKPKSEVYLTGPGNVDATPGFVLYPKEVKEFLDRREVWDAQED